MENGVKGEAVPSQRVSTQSDQQRVTVLTLLKKQIITETVLQLRLYSAWIKMKEDGPDRPAGVNEMMEPQRPGHDDGGGGDVHVPLGRVRLGGFSEM